MSVPASVFTAGAGGNELDSPGTTPPPQSLGNSLGDVAEANHPFNGSAPIPFPGEEDVDDERLGSASEIEAEEQAKTHAGSVSVGREGGGEGGGAIRGRGRAKGLTGGNNVEQAKVARAITAGKKAANLPGTSQLPTARVKKIIMSDPDVDGCGKEATFAIGKACELYVHHLVEEAYTQARLSQRKAIYYKDISKAIKANPHLEFLEDVVPHAMPLSLALAERQRVADYESALEGGSLGTGYPNPQPNTNGNGNDADHDVEDSAVGMTVEGDGEKVRTHSQLTASGKKINKKSRNIRAKKRAALESASEAVGDGIVGEGEEGEYTASEAEGEVVVSDGISLPLDRRVNGSTQAESDVEVDSVGEEEEAERVGGDD